MEYINSFLTEKLAKKILGNSNNARKFLYELNKISEKKFLDELNTKKTDVIWKLVVKYWNYEKGKNIIRELFRNTIKYKRGLDSINAINDLLDEWKKLNLGNVEWPCSQGQFDDLVQKINNMAENGQIKDEKVKLAAVRYRRLKEINTVRNDYLETLIFEKNENIVPTLKHTRGVDFFIDGVSYDQKVARSPTKQFVKQYGPEWKNYAISNPGVVAQYLYTYQDEGRFGADPRLYIVYLDEDIKAIELKNIIDSVDISKPIEISFDFNHKKTGIKTYKTNCFVVLLRK